MPKLREVEAPRRGLAPLPLLSDDHALIRR